MADDLGTYAEHIASATVLALSGDEDAVVLGVGVTDEKGIFGTTRSARLAHPDRVIETPLSENMLTGALMGLVHAGIKPMLVHARADFTTLSAEHLINTLAKWPFMSGEPTYPVPVAVRAIIGQGFGQGPQHSQSLAHVFAGVPGLDVFMPYDAPTAAEAVRDWPGAQKPRVIIEHRRLYGDVFQFDRGYQYRPDADVTLVAVSAAVKDACTAADIIATTGRTARVVPWYNVADPSEPSIDRYTKGPTLFVDVAPAPGVISSALSWLVSDSKDSPINVNTLTPPPYPCPTSFALEQGWYLTPQHIAHAAGKMVGVDIPLSDSVAFQTGEAF